jgi:adenine phosphoribosyltransferase
MNIEERLNAAIRTIPDFPKPGIQFKDITPALHDPVLCSDVTDALLEPFRGQQIDMIAGIESRGFLFGMLMAQRLGCGFTLIRKEGKLPADTIKESYALEYGHAVIEMHADALKKGQRILIHDDLLATGGTASAASSLIQRSGAEVVGFNFLIELAFLGGRARLSDSSDHIVSILSY